MLLKLGRPALGKWAFYMQIQALKLVLVVIGLRRPGPEKGVNQQQGFVFWGGGNYAQFYKYY